MAQAFVRCGAAIVVEDRPEPGRSANMLVSSLLPLVRLAELRREMRLSMSKLASPGATEAVVDQILQFAQGRDMVRQSA